MWIHWSPFKAYRPPRAIACSMACCFGSVRRARSGSEPPKETNNLWVVCLFLYDIYPEPI